MFNYFVIVGPKSDPAKIKSVSNVKFAFEKIFNGKFNFISRSDKSGTHKAEERIWEDTGLNPILDFHLINIKKRLIYIFPARKKYPIHQIFLLKIMKIS